MGNWLPFQEVVINVELFMNYGLQKWGYWGEPALKEREHEGLQDQELVSDLLSHT